ncbi:MAG: hypothetical protein C0485_09475 [Pirellula sp.]|nr:hypothetical protein [Pirellula sp.]
MQLTIKLVIALALAGVAWTPAFAVAPVAAVRTAVLSGQSPVGLTDPEGFTRFDARPVIDGQGRVAFLAAAGSMFEPTSVWAEGKTDLRLVAQANAVAPGLNSTFQQFEDLTLTAEGLIGFKALLTGPTVTVENRESIWLDRQGALTIVARASAEAPDPTKARRFLRFESPAAVNGDGRIAFFARTRDKELEVVQDSGFYAFGTSGLASIAAAAGPAISSEPGVAFNAQSFEAPFADDPVVNAAGVTVFRGFIEGPGVNETNLSGLWKYDPGAGLSLLLRGGDAAAGIPGATFVSFPAIPTINNAGDTAFLAFYHLASDATPSTLSSPTVAPNQAIHLGMWLRKSSGELQTLFTLGDAAPEIVGDAQFIDVFDPVMNGSGRIAIVAAVAGAAVTPTSEVGVWSSGLSADGGLELIARQGDLAPGGTGTIFGVFLEPSMNVRGQTAFMATGYDPAIEPGLSQSIGIWGEDRGGILRLVVESGQWLEVAPGDLRQVASISFTSETGGQDGKPRGFNDAGLLAFHATFVDGSSGIFVSNALAVPEPPAWPLFLGTAAMLWRRSASDIEIENARSFA